MNAGVQDTEYIYTCVVEACHNMPVSRGAGIQGFCLHADHIDQEEITSRRELDRKNTSLHRLKIYFK